MWGRDGIPFLQISNVRPLKEVPRRQSSTAALVHTGPREQASCVLATRWVSLY